MPEDLVDSDITKASTLPSTFYHDSSIFQNVRAAFARSWLFAAHESELAEYSIFPLNQMDDIGEAMILTREDGGEEFRILSNVCTHRGMIVNQKPCSDRSMQCPYHGRTFSLDGKFRNMPEFEGVIGFPSSSDDLKEYDLSQWKGLQFVRIEQDPSDFEHISAELDRRLGWMDIEKFQYDESRDRDYTIAANWALYVDNYLEGFHIPYVHSDLNQTLDYESYHTETFTGGVLQIGVAKDGEPCFDLPETSPEYGQSIGAYYYWIFPNTMLNFYPWGLSVNIVMPLEVDKTRIIYRGYVGNSEYLGKGAGRDLDKVEAEDQVIVESVQKGLNSSSYHRGRFSPERELGVHHFHRMLMRFGP